MKPGIILPTDRSNDACLAIGKEETYHWDTPNGRQYERVLAGNCEMLRYGQYGIDNTALIGLKMSKYILKRILDFKCKQCFS